MKKVDKLQLKLMPFLPTLGYALLLLLGSVVILLSVQFYLDLKPFFASEGGVMGNRSLVVSKRISAMDMQDKSDIYFTENEIDEIGQKSFVSEVSTFKTANFEVKGYMGGAGDVPQFSTDFFMEGIAKQYLDVETDLWDWKPQDSLVPVIIPRSYLQLYNLGFAETKDLPVVSENMLSQISFGLRVSGRGEQRRLRGRIVGFSDQLNSILVPEDFINWGNENFATLIQQQPNRLLLTLSRPDDPEVASFFEDNNYEIDKGTLKQNKVWFFFQIVFIFLFAVAVIIIILSCLAMFMGLNLMFHKNKTSFNNLALLGYSNARMTRLVVLSSIIIVLLVSLLAALIATSVRGYLREEIISIYRLSLGHQIWIMALVLVIVLTLWNYGYIAMGIKKINKTATA